MCTQDEYLGCLDDLEALRALTDRLNAKAVEQVNDTQELVMLNNFSRECNESQFKKCLQQRIADIASWHWVLKDLSKRLDEAIAALQYEHNALRVVTQRVQNEIDEHSRDASRPGACCPFSDVVEDAINQEFKFLRDHKKKFEKMILELENEIKALQKTKKRIDIDIFAKQQAISVDEACAKITTSSMSPEKPKKKKKRASPINRWEKRCASLKVAGLKALSSATIARQQVRGARTHLSIAAQAYAARVDSALRRRLHSNKIKLQDLKWQREEALKDYNSLEAELKGIEQNLLENMEQERVIEARLLDRTLRPPGELIRDEVDRKLRDELGRLRCFSKQLRTNLDRTTFLQNHLADSMSRIDCCAEDLLQIICLDEDRIKSRLGDVAECTCHKAGPPATPSKPSPKKTSDTVLSSIKEEEEDDYPINE